MILDIPTSADFEANGVAFLNLAWEAVLGLSLDLAESETEELDEEDRVTDEYWEDAQRPLAVAVALAQQGTEFLLKAKISAVSPYLLISGEPAGWPKGCDKEDKSFADFKTIDAQDLVRVYDTVASSRLSDSFKREYERLRRLRNTVMHTVDKRLRFTAEEGILAILQVVEALLAPRKWLALRREYLQGGVDVAREHGHGNNTDCVMARETVHVIDLLEPAQVKQFYEFDPKQRRYYCPNCEHGCADWQIGVTLAQLRPNTPESTSVHCLVCDQIQSVVREECGHNGCKGNVISEDYGVCLTCWHQK
jgi:hypothetical protein